MVLIQLFDFLSEYRTLFKQILLTKSMQNNVKVYSHLRNSPKHITVTPVNVNNLQPKSPINNKSLLSSTNSPNRPSSPRQQKTKIRLVSPQRSLNQSAFIHKQNNPPSQAMTKSQKHSEGLRSPRTIELGGKTAEFIAPTMKIQANQNSNVSIVNHFQKTQTVPVSPSRGEYKRIMPVIYGNYPNRQVIQTSVQNINRTNSPQRVCFNNRNFDLGAIKSQIVYVTPISHKRGHSDQINAGNFFKKPEIEVRPIVAAEINQQSATGHVWPSELVIQEENNIQELRESYESEMKDIKQLQQQIQNNNLQIKQLLKSSRVSKHTTTSKKQVKQGYSQKAILTNRMSDKLSAHDIEQVQSQTGKKLSQSHLEREQEVHYMQANYSNPKDVFNSKFSHTAHVDKHQKKETVPSCSHHTLINELITNKKIEQRVGSSSIKVSKDEVSVQTEQYSQLQQELPFSKTDSKFRKLEIIHNAECQIQMVMSASVGNKIEEEKQHSIIYKSQTKLAHQELFRQPVKKNFEESSQPSLVYLFKTHENIPTQTQHVQKSVTKMNQLQQIANQIVPVSQQSLTSSNSAKSQTKVQQVITKNNFKITEAEQNQIEKEIKNKIVQAKLNSNKQIKESSSSIKQNNPVSNTKIQMPHQAIPSKQKIEQPADNEVQPAQNKVQSRKISNRIYM